MDPHNTSGRNVVPSIPSDIKIDKRFSVPVFGNQDDALSLAYQFPAGRALLWDEVETVSPCWLRAYNGNTPFFVPAFQLTAANGNSTVVIALREGSELSEQFVLAVPPPTDGPMTVAGFLKGKVEPTLLAP